MAPITENELKSEAIKYCKEHLNRLIEEELVFVPELGDREWNTTLLRYVFEQSIVVWRYFNHIELTISQKGQVIKFRDPRRFGNAEFQTLNDDQIVNISKPIGLLGKNPHVVDTYQGPDGMLNTIIHQDDPAFPRKLLVTINPTSRQVAAFEVIHEENE